MLTHSTTQHTLHCVPCGGVGQYALHCATCIESHKTHTAGVECNCGVTDQRSVRDLTLMMRVQRASVQPSVRLLPNRLEGESVVCAVKHSVRIITTCDTGLRGSQHVHSSMYLLHGLCTHTIIPTTSVHTYVMDLHVYMYVSNIIMYLHM